MVPRAADALLGRVAQAFGRQETINRSAAPVRGAVAALALYAAALGLSGTALADAGPDTSLSPPAGDAAAAGSTQASYDVTFTGIWTTDVTPGGGMPDGAHFSPLIGGVHNAAVAFLEAGGMATPGVESMAERGRTATLTKEIEAAGRMRSASLSKNRARAPRVRRPSRPSPSARTIRASPCSR